MPFSLHHSVIGHLVSQDMAERILAPWFLLGQDQVNPTQSPVWQHLKLLRQDFPELNFDAFKPQDPFNKHVDVQGDHNVFVSLIGPVSHS